MRVSVAGLVAVVVAWGTAYAQGTGTGTGTGKTGTGAGAAVASTSDRFVFELTPEAPDAAKLGAAEVSRAQKLAKGKQFADAVSALEGLSRRLPASVHDCNLALAYLRASVLTKAQLAWDLALLRNGARPKWCTGQVSTELSEALRAAKYVPTSLEIEPADALVEVGGAAVRGMRTIWLPAQPVTITVSAPGYASTTVTHTIAAPTARITIALQRPVDPTTTSNTNTGAERNLSTGGSDAAVSTGQPPPWGGTETGPGTDSWQGAGDGAGGQPPQPQPQPQPQQPQPQPQPADGGADPLIRVGSTAVGYRTAALTVAIVGWVGAGFFGYMTWDAKQKANERYVTDPAYQDLRDEYRSNATVTLGAAVLGAVASGVYVYFLTREDKVIPKPGSFQVGRGVIDVGVGADGVGVTYSGSFGGGGR